MKNKAVDEYIAKCEDFAHPILNYLRALIHECVPNIEENIKWRMPSFELNGKIIYSYSGHKKHCVFRFVKGHLMKDPNHLLQQIGKTEMYHIGNINSLDQLPAAEILKSYIKNAILAIEKK